MQHDIRDNNNYKIILKTAELLSKCANYLNDLDIAKRNDNNHCYTYYAVDTDVLMLYLDPEKNVNYLDVFGEGPSSKTTKSLAFLLGDFLFKSTEPLITGHENKKCRFLLIPPHDEELLRILSAMHLKLSRFSGRIYTRTFKELTKIFTQYEKDDDNKKLISELRKHVPELVELYNPFRGPKAALMRYASLSDSTFQRIETYLEDDFTFPLLDPINNQNDEKISDQLNKQWQTRLEKSKSYKQPQYALLTDAEVLATIEYCNSNLQDTGKQLVLITGSNYLFNAANKYIPDSDNNLTFADMYLRHPQSFLSHEKFFSFYGSKTTDFRLADWFKIFFPSGLYTTNAPQRIVDRSFLHKIQKKEFSNFQTIIEALANVNMQPKQLLHEWKSQITTVAKARYSNGLDLADERGALQLAHKLEELRNTSDWSVEKLKKLVFKESFDSINALYSMAVWIGLWSTTPVSEFKGVPALRFDGDYQEIEHYCDKVIKLQRRIIDKKTEQDQLEQLLIEYNKDVVETDTSFYHAYVIHALAFASKGQWYVAITLSKIAMNISDNIDPSERGSRKGREAAYLACIAARRFAKNRSSLDKANKYLNEAFKRQNEGWAEDIRFKSERFAIDIRAHYFDLFCEHKSLDFNIINSTLNKLHHLLDEAECEDNLPIKLWVQRQICTNFFTLLLITRDLKKNETVLSQENIVKNLGILKEILKNKQYNFKRKYDPYAFLICDISTAIYDPSPDNQEAARKIASKVMDKWDHFYTPYDKERLVLLKRCI